MQALSWPLAVILLPQILRLLERAQGEGERGRGGRAGKGWGRSYKEWKLAVKMASEEEY